MEWCWSALFILGTCTWLINHFAAERYWLATLVLFGPQVLLLVPWGVLTLLTVVYRRRLIGTAVVTLVTILGPVLHVGTNVRMLFTHVGPASHGAQTLRVLTINTHYTALRVDTLRQLIADTEPDVIAIQEWDSSLHSPLFDGAPWYLVQNDDACLASRYPLRMMVGPQVSLAPVGGGAYTYEILTPGGAVPFFNVHLESPHLAFRQAIHFVHNGTKAVTDNSIGRGKQAAELHREAANSGDAVIMAGDLNLPPESMHFRAHLAGFTDAFAAAGWGIGLTYRSLTTATRIDHILAGKAWKCERCWVGPDVGSQHRPVIADFRRAVDSVHSAR